MSYAENGAESDVGGVAGWVTDVIDSIGEVGVGALIALENIFPPIPSEVILPFAGFSASQGGVNVWWAWVAATIGALVGAWVLYAVGALFGRERLYELSRRRWFILFGPSELRRGEAFFERRGDLVVLLARCVPLLRSIVSVPAGVERMPLVRFSVLTAIGSGVWNAIFIWLGYELGDRYHEVEDWMAPLSYVVLAVVIVGVVWLTVQSLRTEPDDAGA